MAHMSVLCTSGAGMMLAAILSLCAGSTCALGAPPTRVVTAAGVGSFAAPGVSGGLFSVLGAPQLDANGGVLVTCRFAGPGVTYAADDLGLFSFDRSGAGVLLQRTGILSGQGAAMGYVPGAQFSATFFPRLRADGSIASVSFLSGAAVNASNSTGYWTGSRAGLDLTYRSGSTSVPGVEGAQFNGFITGFPCVMSGAGMAFSGQMAVGLGGVTINDYQGIWGPRVGGSGELELIARPGIPVGAGSPPGGVGLVVPTYVTMNPKSLVMSDNGRVAFGATLAMNLLGGVDATNDTVIVERRADGTMAYAAREGSEVPGHPGVVFKSLDLSAFVQTGGMSIDGSGDLAFGEIDGSDAPTEGVSRLWRRRATGEFELLAARGVAVGAGTPTGILGTFATIQAPAMNSVGTVVFAGSVNTPGGVLVSGLWVCEPATSVPRLILRTDVADTGRSPPGIPGAMFSPELPARGTYQVNVRGQVFFKWKLQDGPGGVAAGNDDGLWAYDASAWLLSVVRLGDVVTVAPGVAAPVTAISVFLGPGGDDDGRIRYLNDQGQCAYTVQFSTTSGALLVSQLPGAGACCRGATCVQASSDQCVGPNARFAGIGTVCGGAMVCCVADFDQSGSLDALDIFAYLDAWFAGSASAEADGVPGLSADDVFAFLAEWFGGC